MALDQSALLELLEATARIRAAPHERTPARVTQRNGCRDRLVMEAYVHGVSTRKVDDLVVAMGADTGISKTEVAFRYVFLDACYCKARVGGDRRGRGSRVTAPGGRGGHRGQRRWPPRD
jgi:hypothetical protein